MLALTNCEKLRSLDLWRARHLPDGDLVVGVGAGFSVR